MNRRKLFRLSAVMGLGASLSGVVHAAQRQQAPTALPPPAAGSIKVAFLLSDNAVMIDFAGPWEVFDNVSVPGRGEESVFQLYTVAASRDPIKASGGMRIVPDFTYATAPQPHVIVIPAQSAHDEAVLDWIREASGKADLTMSVCTGAFLLAKTGLLDGKAATTHHGSYLPFAMSFPQVALKRGARFVEAGKVASAGGLSSGIDLALRVVERYFGRAVASNTANALEYQGQGWLNPDANQAYAKRRRSTDRQPLCPVCEMDVDKTTAASSFYRGRKYYFCMAGHKAAFDAGPQRFLDS